MDVHPTKNVSIGIDPYPYQIYQPSCLVGSGCEVPATFAAAAVLFHNDVHLDLFVGPRGKIEPKRFPLVDRTERTDRTHRKTLWMGRGAAKLWEFSENAKYAKYSFSDARAFMLPLAFLFKWKLKQRSLLTGNAHFLIKHLIQAISIEVIQKDNLEKRKKDVELCWI